LPIADCQLARTLDTDQNRQLPVGINQIILLSPPRQVPGRSVSAFDLGRLSVNEVSTVRGSGWVQRLPIDV
jgi:hypothetical protein